MGADRSKEDPRAWLFKPNPIIQEQQAKKKQPHSSTSTTSRPAAKTRRPQTEPAHGLTDTMYKPSEFQNMLTAVVHPYAPSGYRDPADPCNRTDRRNGGEFRRFESTYSKVFANVDDRPIQFRKDGLPISAQKVPGKPLMAPKLPSVAYLSVSKRLCAKYNHTTSVCIGMPGRKDPHHFNSVYSLVHTAPHRALGQPNPGIAAEDAAGGRKQLGLFS